jgi:hypothetical protein
MTRSVLCPGTDCKKREQCLLYTTPPTAKWQCYLTMACSVKDVDKFRWFESNEEKSNAS